MRKRRYVQIDLNTGNILAFDIKPVKMAEEALKENWFSISNDAYETILLNQSKLIVNIPALIRYFQNNKAPLNKDIITMDFLIITHSLRKAKLAKKEQNNRYKNLYIDYGIKHNNIVYPFTFEDRIRYAEQSINKYKNKYINTENGIVKVTKEEFDEIYSKQLINQRHWEAYTEKYNSYVDTLNSYEEITNLGYEIQLPDEYKIEEDDTIESLIKELETDLSKENVFAKLQDLEFTIKEMYKYANDDTTFTGDISDIQINNKSKELVKEADDKYRKVQETEPEFWSNELEKTLKNITGEGISRISVPSLTKAEREALNNLDLTIVDGVKKEQIAETNKIKATKDQSLLRENIVIKKAVTDYDKMMEEADIITNAELDDLIAEVDQ